MEDDVTAETIAGNVRAALAYRAINGKQAAAHLGMKQAQFSRRYNAIVPWKAGEIGALSELLNVSIRALIEGDGLREPTQPSVEVPVTQEPDAVTPDVPDPAVVEALEAVERRRELLGDRLEELLEVCRRLTGDLDRTRVALEFIQRELRDL